MIRIEPKRRADPKNIGKCAVCQRHLIYEEVINHMRLYHHSEWIRILKDNGL